MDPVLPGAELKSLATGTVLGCGGRTESAEEKDGREGKVAKQEKDTRGGDFMGV